MKSWQGMIITFAIVAVFSLALINFSVIFQVSNNANQTILEDSPLSTFNSSVYSDLTDFRNETIGFKNATESETLKTPEGELTLGSFWNSLKKFSKFTFAFATSIFYLAGDSLGIDRAFVNIFFVILIIVAIFSWWRVIKTGT